MGRFKMGWGGDDKPLDRARRCRREKKVSERVSERKK